MRGRLNLFQSAMLRWRDLHPYNALHVVRVEAALDAARLACAIGQQLAWAGLTGLALDRARRRYEYRGGTPAFELAEVAAPDGDRDAALAREIEAQLNRPFPPDGPIDPFRFFAVRDDGAFRLGLAYDHFVAGGDAIVVLLHDVVRRYLGAPVEGIPPQRYPPAFRRLFVRHAGAFLRGLAWLPRMAASCRRGIRPTYRDFDDGHNGFTRIRLATEVLRRTAKAWNVTFNDLLLALTLRALDAHVPRRSGEAKRHELGVASIVNLRGEFGFGAREVFGQFLSSIRLARPAPASIPLEQLARDVHRETAAARAGRAYLQTLFGAALNGLYWRILKPKLRSRHYAKFYPVWAGLTSLHVDALWTAAGDGGAPRDYLRAVPTGPLAPLVVAATTCGDAVHLGLSYRRSAFDREKIDRIAASIAASAAQLP